MVLKRLHLQRPLGIITSALLLAVIHFHGFEIFNCLWIGQVDVFVMELLYFSSLVIYLSLSIPDLLDEVSDIFIALLTFGYLFVIGVLLLASPPILEYLIDIGFFQYVRDLLIQVDSLLLNEIECLDESLQLFVVGLAVIQLVHLNGLS